LEAETTVGDLHLIRETRAQWQEKWAKQIEGELQIHRDGKRDRSFHSLKSFRPFSILVKQSISGGQSKRFQLARGSYAQVVAFAGTTWPGLFGLRTARERR